MQQAGEYDMHPDRLLPCRLVDWPLRRRLLGQSMTAHKETCWRPSCKLFGCHYPSLCQYDRAVMTSDHPDETEIATHIEWARPKFYFWLGRDAEAL
jgi:hypothetical protein